MQFFKDFFLLLEKMKVLLILTVMSYASAAYKTGYKMEIPKNYNTKPDYHNMMNYGEDGHDVMPSELDPDGDGIFGEAGKDYPVFNQAPPTEFKCDQQKFPGYYGDPSAKCQVFHICQSDGTQATFLCPNGSIFNQAYFVCDWWYNVDCSKATSFYPLNSELFKQPPPASSPPKSYPAPPPASSSPPKSYSKPMPKPVYPKETISKYVY